MTQFPDASFAVVFFSCNDSCMDHEGRLQILLEVHGIPSPSGAFAFSYSLNADYHPALGDQNGSPARIN